MRERLWWLGWCLRSGDSLLAAWEMSGIIMSWPPRTRAEYLNSWYRRNSHGIRDIKL